MGQPCTLKKDMAPLHRLLSLMQAGILLCSGYVGSVPMGTSCGTGHVARATGTLSLSGSRISTCSYYNSRSVREDAPNSSITFLAQAGSNLSLYNPKPICSDCGSTYENSRHRLIVTAAEDIYESVRTMTCGITEGSLICRK